jgi:glyoxylase-like metal-dependent hydrolase (beta-lactamase superfamily II)
MELAPAVHALPLSFDYDETGTEMVIHPALVETDRGPILVDVGLPGAVGKLERRLDELDYDLADVRTVVLTHHDGDHAGALRELLERTDAITFAHREETPFVVGARDPIKATGDRYPPAPIDVEIVDAVTFRTRAGPMRVVETPGHSPGHVSLYLPDERLLIAGDALTAEEGLDGPNPEFTPEMGRATRSLAALSDLEVDRILCYHGGAVDEGTESIAAIRDRLERS